MIDALRTIGEGILTLAIHGGVLVLVFAAMLAIILLTAWFDGGEYADRSHRRRRPHRREPPRENAADRDLH